MMAAPADRALYNPSFWKHYEPVLVAAPDDLHLPWSGSCHGCGHLRLLIAGIVDDPLKERELALRLAQQRFGTISILGVGQVDHHTEQQAERVG